MSPRRGAAPSSQGVALKSESSARATVPDAGRSGGAAVPGTAGSAAARGAARACEPGPECRDVTCWAARARWAPERLRAAGECGPRGHAAEGKRRRGRSKCRRAARGNSARRWRNPGAVGGVRARSRRNADAAGSAAPRGSVGPLESSGRSRSSNAARRMRPAQLLPGGMWDAQQRKRRHSGGTADSPQGACSPRGHACKQCPLPGQHGRLEPSAAAAGRPWALVQAKGWPGRAAGTAASSHRRRPRARQRRPQPTCRSRGSACCARPKRWQGVPHRSET